MIKKTNKKLAIVSGANGALGRTYLEYLSQSKSWDSIGLVRTEAKKSLAKVKYALVDLEDTKSIQQSLSSLDWSSYDQILFIHAVGKFKFEENGVPEIDKNNDFIDDEVWTSNYETFLNVSNVLQMIQSREDSLNHRVELVLVGFGSISDKYSIPYFKSYRESKKALRNYLHNLVLNRQSSGKVVARIIDVSTTNTGNEEKLRPFADKTYWLSPSEIVDRSMRVILDLDLIWGELEVFKPRPDFDHRYYHNHQSILKKWKKEMKGGAEK